MRGFNQIQLINQSPSCLCRSVILSEPFVYKWVTFFVFAAQLCYVALLQCLRRTSESILSPSFHFLSALCSPLDLITSPLIRTSTSICPGVSAKVLIFPDLFFPVTCIFQNRVYMACYKTAICFYTLNRIFGSLNGLVRRKCFTFNLNRYSRFDLCLVWFDS